MTDEELKQLLKRNVEISEESLRILKKINRARIIGNVYSFLKWVIIIGVSAGAYYYLQPYLQKLMDTFNAVNSQANQIKNIKNLLPR